MKIGLEALYRANDPERAARYFRWVLKQSPEHYGANLQLAKSLDLLGEYDEARRHWMKILELARRRGAAFP